MKHVSGPARKGISLHKHSWRLVLIVGMFFALCVAIFTLQTPVPASAAVQRSLTCSSLTSSPTQGPVGAVVAVSCTGANQPDGTKIQLGYTTNFVSCNAVADSQVGAIQNHAFSGWLRWPSSTGTGTFSVCASVAGSNSPTIADNTYQVLSATPPQAAVAPAIPEAGKQATVTGANFLPAGTNVNLIWQTANGGQSVSLGTATSDANGAFSQTFTVPVRAITGSYTLTALTGGTQPPTLSAATTFHVNGITLVAVPTPTAQPDPAASPATSPTVSASPTTASHTLTTGTPTSTGGNNGGTAGLLLPIGLVGLLLIVAALVAGVFVVRRRRGLALAAASAVPQVSAPFAQGQGAMYQANTLPPPAYPARGRVPVLPGGGAASQAPIPFDPGLAEAMRQAQVSLFATPRPPVGEEVLS